MARPLRIEFENAWYHVMNRGSSHCATFTTDIQREIFLNLLGESVEMFGIEVHAYCLMGNHYHLLLKTPFANLSRAMRHIDGVYTQRFNRLERRDGPLFRGRYKSIIVDADNYLVAVSRYIHRNPIDAEICDGLIDYPWSSYPVYVGAEMKPAWLTTHDVLRYSFPPGPEAYRAFVENPLLPSLREYYDSKHVSLILGSKAFRSYAMSRASYGSTHPEIPQIRKTMGRPTIHDIVESSAYVFEQTIDRILVVRRGQANIARKAAMYIARKKFGYDLNDIAKVFCLDYSSVSCAVAKFEKGELGSTRDLQEYLQEAVRRAQLSQQTKT